MRANAALILAMSVAASTGAAIRVSPAFGAFDVSSVVIAGISRALVLLCQISIVKSGCFCKQHGHLGRATTRAAVRQRRMEAMECGT